MRIQRYLFSFAALVGVFVVSRVAAAAPHAVVDPASFSAGSVHVGTASPTSGAVTVTNNASGGGSDTLTITAVTKDPANAQCNDFAITTTPAIPSGGLDLLDTESMALNVTFTPAARGPRSCVVTISDNDGDHAVTLSGTGTAPQMQVTWSGSPGNLSCGSAKVTGGQSTCTVTVANGALGNENLDITALITADPTEFTVTSVSQSSIPVGQSSTITITFDPNTAGTRTGQVTITGDDPANSSDNVGLTAAGTTAILSLPASLDFGSIHVATPVFRSLGVHDTGTAPMAIDSLTIGGADASSFAFTDHGCSGQTCNPAADIVVGAGSTESFSLRCTPSSLGAKTATLTIAADNESGTNSLTLTCHGTLPDISVSATSHTFADTRVGTPRQFTLAIDNTATGIDADALEYTIAKGGADPGNFTVSPACTTGCNVPVGGPADSIVITFTPSARRTFSATLTITSDDPDESPVTVTLSGKGIAPVIGNPSPAGQTIGFGLVDVGTNSTAMTASISNAGDDTLAVSAVTLVGANPSQFAIVSGTTGSHTVTAGSSDAWQIRCNPTSIGNKTAQLQIQSDALGATTFAFDLTCTGQQAVFSFTPIGGLDFGGVFVGTTPSPVLTTRITNIGNATGDITTIMSSNAPFGFAVQGGGPPRTLAAGQFIDVAVTFTPVDGTNFTTAKLTVATTGSPASFEIPVKGDGRTVGAEVAVSGEPDLSVDLGNIKVGNAVTRAVTVTNNGDTGVTMSLPSSNDSHCQVQPISPASYPAPLAGNGGVALFNINTTATALGGGHCEITVTTTASSMPTMVTIDYVGVAPGFEMLNPTSGTLDYAAVDVDSQQTQTIQFRNNGTYPLTISGCSLTGSTRFSLPTPCSSSQQVPVGATASFDVRFDPVLEAAESATLRFNLDALGVPEAVVALRGIGIDQHIDLPATDYGFRPTFRNPDDDDIPEVLVTVRNPRSSADNPGAPLTVSMSMVEAENAYVFPLPSPGPFTIEPGGELHFPVWFTPPAINPSFQGTLTFYNDTTAQPMAQVTLHGAGISRAVTVAPGEYDLGVTGVGVPVRLSDLTIGGLVVQNVDPNGEPYVVRALGIVDAQGERTTSASFRLIDGETPRDLAPMSALDYDVEFLPQSEGEFEVLVGVYLDHDTLVHSTVRLHGRAIPVELQGGAGCQASGDGGLGALAVIALALGLLLARRRRRDGGVLIVLAIAGAGGAARADTTRNIDLSTFAPVPTTEVETFTVESPQVGVSGAWAVGLMLDYATDVLTVVSPQAEGMTDKPVTSRTAMQLAFAYAFLDQFEAGVRMPFYQQDGTMPSFSGLRPASGNAFGDLAGHIKAKLLDGPITLGASLDVTLPTATDDQFAGADGPSGHVRGLFGWRGHRAGLTLNTGLIARQPGELGDIKQGNALTYGAGAWVRARDKLWAIGELFGSSGMGSPGDGVQQLEAVVGVRYELVESVGLSVGGGRGILAGIGAPALRGFLLLDVAPRARPVEPLAVAGRPRPRDTRDDDGDGVVNSDDDCRADAEDRDGYRDEDGCPEPDNDDDRVLDAADRCPVDAEDLDGFEDGDGCVDADNDGDKIADVDDQCPLEPEDLDGYLDNDGCDDPDNDGDGIPDPIDQCALEQETINGKTDDDGCPDDGDSLVMVMPDRIEIFEPVGFDGTSARLTRKSANVLGQVAATLRANRDFARVRVTVHVHPRGSEDQALSDKRARAVREWLLRWGIEPERIEARGLGSTRPLVPKTQKGAAQLNDRVEFIILEKAIK